MCPIPGVAATVVKVAAEVSAAAKTMEGVASALEEGEVVEAAAKAVVEAKLPSSLGDVKPKMKLPDASGSPKYTMKLPNALNLRPPDVTSLKVPETNKFPPSNIPSGIGENVDSIKAHAFNSLDAMKSGLDMTYKEIKADKPPNSPNLAKWFDSGGSVSIVEKDGKPIWTYIDSAKRAVSYVDGYPVFPPEAKHPLIEDIDIGSFSDRTVDKQLYLKKLEDLYGLTEIPAGYMLHHDSKNGIMQLIRSDYHKEFTHVGGHSLFKEM